MPDYGAKPDMVWYECAACEGAGTIGYERCWACGGGGGMWMSKDDAEFWRQMDEEAQQEKAEEKPAVNNQEFHTDLWGNPL